MNICQLLLYISQCFIRKLAQFAVQLVVRCSSLHQLETMPISTDQLPSIYSIKATCERFIWRNYNVPCHLQSHACRVSVKDEQVYSPVDNRFIVLMVVLLMIFLNFTVIAIVYHSQESSCKCQTCCYVEQYIM